MTAKWPKIVDVDDDKTITSVSILESSGDYFEGTFVVTDSVTLQEKTHNFVVLKTELSD